MKKKHDGILDQAIVLLFLIALVGYLPTARNSDRTICLGALLILLLRTAWLTVRREVRIAMDINVFLYILLILWSLLSCFWSKSITDFLTYLKVSFPIVLCSAVCLNTYIGQRISPDRFLHLLIWAGVVAGLRYCCYTDWSSLSDGYYLRGSFGSLLDDVTNYNNYTMIISASCVVALYYAIVEHRRIDWLPALILLVILLLGGSRKNIVALPIIAILFSLFAGNGQKKVKTLLLLLAVVVVGMYLLETLPALSQIRSAMEGMFNGLFHGEEADVDGSTQERMYLMEQGIRVWKEHPFLGVGWNNYRYYNDARLYAHNNYVEMLASLGIVGFLLYYAVFLRVVYIVGAAFLRRSVRKEDVLLLGFSLSMLIMEFGSITLYNKERVVLLLVIFYWHSYTTKRRTYVLALK